ncbi:MAG TPA: class I SAM-dependent methyltransferase [Kofleriaceae bacterium]|nr:class I SAM-dependent methyltransferase [Kofleriaceae bacterium]
MSADHFQRVYRERAEDYDRLVAAEDADRRLMPAILEVAPRLARVLEVGAGTGRITRQLVARGAEVLAIDRAPAMLRVARRHLPRAALVVADAAALPVAPGWADAAIAGWVLGHQRAWNPDGWRASIAACLDEMARGLAPGGVSIVIETLGTGVETPRPSRELAEVHAWLEAERGFSRRELRTDYRFASAAEAAELCGFFFGDAVAVRGARVPECTGLWWRRG